MWLSHMDLVFQEGCSGRTDCQRATGWMTVTCPWEEGRPRVCTQRSLHCHLLPVPGWKVSCLKSYCSCNLSLASTPSKIRTRVAANQGRVWRMKGTV